MGSNFRSNRAGGNRKGTFRGLTVGARPVRLTLPMRSIQQPAGEVGAKINERLLLFVLAAIQFTTVVDFLIIMPLGPQYMRVFHISPSQFGLIVSAYAVAAGLSGIGASLFLDRHDRKRALMVLYGGFTIGTLMCALAPTYVTLAMARAMAGAFGGVCGAIILAIVGDVIPDSRRGAAMGLVMSSFSIASICGVPLGLLLATHISWHIPFLVLAGLSLLILLAAMKALPHLRGHLQHAHDVHPVRRLLNVLGHRDHQLAFLFMIALTCAGFCIFPYMSTYMVANVGLTEKQLPLIYLCGGTFTIFSMNLIGRWADRAGKRRVFVIMSSVCMLPVLIMTNLPPLPVAMAISASTFFMICLSGRMVPAMALMTGSIEPRYRGGFMSVNSAMQQLASGLAAFLSGMIMGQDAAGHITRFWAIGLFSVACLFLSIVLSRHLKLRGGTAVPVAATVEG